MLTTILLPCCLPYPTSADATLLARMAVLDQSLGLARGAAAAAAVGGARTALTLTRASRVVRTMRAKGAAGGLSLPPVFVLYDVDALTTSFLTVQREFT